MNTIYVSMYYRFLVFTALSYLTQACPQGCTCTHRGADCVQVGVDAVSINLNSKLLDYNFTKNNVGALNENYFAQLLRVQFLILRSNQITEIHPDTLMHNSDLRRLDLGYNRLKKLPPQLFQKTRKLEEFYCESNNLTSINEKLFDGLSNLKSVMLENNQLKKIPSKAFFTNILLTRLYLENNQLETAEWFWISHFNHTHEYELYLDNNPWSCDCRMKYFKRNVTKHNWPQHAHGKKHRISLPHCQNIPAKPSVTDYDLANFTCESPKLLNAPNCTVKTQHPQCKVMLVEGQSGQVKCGGEGKPTPLAQLYDKAGYPVTMQAAESVTIRWKSVTTDKAGTYFCVLKGFDKSGKPVTLKTEISVTVKSHFSPTGLVFGLLFGILAIAGVVYYYKRIYKTRAGYGSLVSYKDSVPILYEKKEAEETSVAEVTYLDDDDDDENKHFDRNSFIDNERNDEKEVLV